MAVAAAGLTVGALAGVAAADPAKPSVVGPCTGSSPQPITHVVVVVMENHGYSSIIGSPSAPYINSLAASCGLATAYHAVSHPSLPNYLAMTGGSTFGIRDDQDPAAHRITATSVFQQLGTGWRSYEQSMPSACLRTNAGTYAVRHNPAAYFTALAGCPTQDVPLPTVPTFSARLTFVTPDLVHDMHDGTIAQGDAWLSGFVTRMVAGPAYRSGSLALFVAWDENGGTDGGPTNHVPCLVVAPSVRPGTRDATTYTHYSLLASIEDLLGLPRISNAAAAASMVAMLRHTPPPKEYTTITPLLQLGSPDIVRAHLTHGTTTARGADPIYRGQVTLWTHDARTTTWSVVGTASTDSNGWAYLVVRPRYWAAYRWTFSGTTRFYGTTSSVVTTTPSTGRRSF